MALCGEVVLRLDHNTLVFAPRLGLLLLSFSSLVTLKILQCREIYTGAGGFFPGAGIADTGAGVHHPSAGKFFPGAGVDFPGTIENDLS